MKAASAYQYRNKLVIAPMDETVSGFCVEVDPFFVIDPSNPKIVGEAIIRALTRPLQRVPDPSRQNRNMDVDPVMALLGIKVRSTFTKEARLVGIVQQNGSVTLTPYMCKRPRGWFLPLHDKDRTAPLEVELLGQALLNTFDDSI